MFSHLKIKTRVSLLAFLSVLSAVILSAFHFYGDWSVNEQSVKFKQYNSLKNYIHIAERQALQMRQREKDFLIRKDPKYIKKYEQAVAAFETALQQAEKLQIKSAEDQIRNLKKDVKLHHAQFLLVTKMHKKIGLSEKEGLRGKLRKAVHTVEKKLEETNLDNLKIKMHMMRRHEKDFMLRGHVEYIGRIDKRRSEFDQLLSETFYTAETKAEISSSMDDYQNGFKAYAETTSKLIKETKKLSQIFKVMQPHLKSIIQISNRELQQSENHLEATKSFTKQLFLIIFVLISSAAIGLGLLIGRSITKPINGMTAAMLDLSKGNTNIDIPHRGERNAIGEMAEAMAVFKENAIAKIEAEKQRSKQQKIRQEKHKQLEAAIEDFTGKIEAIVKSLLKVSDHQNVTAHTMADISESTSDQASSATSAAQQASESVQAVAIATEELTSTINEISTQIEQTSRASKQAVSEVNKTGDQMAQLMETADKIGEVIELISGIAEQTNLLALNATIESARAGEAGKGFAVVAAEVKQLATQTAGATEEISRQIEDIQNASKQVSGSMDNVSQIIHGVDEISAAVASAMEEQGAATQEIASNINYATEGTNRVSDSISHVSDASQETGSASEQVLTTVENLGQQITVLQKEVDHFVDQIRAA